jgi:hypothetical protein
MGQVMTDTEWMEIRERWRLKCKDGNLDCADDMVPFLVDRKSGVPYGWVSRQHIESVQEVTSDPKFKLSVAKSRELLP